VATPAGWFADPWRIAPWRWWDGYQWTPYVWPTGPTRHLDPAALTKARRKEISLLNWAKVGLASILLAEVSVLIGTFHEAHAFLSDLDRFNQNLNGQSTPLSQSSFGLSGWTYVLQAAVLGVAVVFFMWQHAAATVAQGLGYPARLSPGRGIGVWFLPLANFWQPYHALSDLLPPDHPMRPLCLRAWVAWYGATFVNLVAFFSVLASPAAAVTALALGALLIIYTYVTGWRLINAVHEIHTRHVSMTQT
jgi:hypothetical protein